MSAHTFLGHAQARDGYGLAVKKVGDILKRMARDWDVVDMRESAAGLQPHNGITWDVDGDAVALCVPDWLPYILAHRRISYTMFESSRLLRERVEILNSCAERVIVPCQWNAETFRESGVTLPIDVVGLGVDALDYPLLERAPAPAHPYTFLWSGTGDQRKGWDLVYRAFCAAGFVGRDDVRLILHFRSLPEGLHGCGDANVIVYRGLFDPAAILALYARTDCYLFPSRGEGWGLPPREAAATGLPVIATDYGGLAEGITHWALPLRVRGLAEARYGLWEAELGLWAEPDVDHLVELMRGCFERREDAAAFGQQASAWLREHQSWEDTARGVIMSMEALC